MGYYEGFFFGLGGGAAVELLKWWNLRDDLNKTGVPDWSKSLPYWVITILMAAAGGGLVVVYLMSGAVLTAFLAVHVGASTPLIITGIAREVPKTPGNVD